MSLSETSASLDLIRSQFPALASGFAYLENAGGSQVPQMVADAMRDYMLNSYVQLGAGYPDSLRATQVVDHAHAFLNTFMNGDGIGQTILGPSTTQLISMLAHCYEQLLTPGDEIVISEIGHEANIGAWEKLSRKGVVIKTWKVDPETFESPISDLKQLLSDRTRIVAIVHVSNLLGGILDVAEVARLAHAVGAKVVVDGVAYAPHREIDVAAWDVDWYVFSVYKVFGPHMAALFGKFEAFDELNGPNHFFLDPKTPYKFELGGVNHEGCAGVLAIKKYFDFLGGTAGVRETLSRAYERFTELEMPLQERLMEYLLSKPQVKVIGPQHADASRVPTISFVHERKPAPEIVAQVDKKGIGIRYGHMYAYRMCKALGIDTDEGVVRVSAVHYNTVEEIERLIDVIDEVT